MTKSNAPQCQHRGSLVPVGPYTVLAGGTLYLEPEDLQKAEIVIPLSGKVPAGLGQRVSVLACPWEDFAPPPEGFEQFLREEVLPLLAEGKRLLIYCSGGHGRTGTFLASLIAILEPETPDPIAAIRARYCQLAVETAEQARSIFALRGKRLPAMYRRS